MEQLGFRIVTQFKRPDPALVDGFKGISSSNVGDCIGRTAALDCSLRPYNRTPLLGVAVTVKSPPRDNLMIHKAMDMLQPGDILVVAAGGDTGGALVGELMTRHAILKKVGGIIVDGCIRDTDAIAKMDLPVYARASNPNGVLSRSGPGEINVPVIVGGKEICPGDILIGDADGLIVLKPSQAEQVLEQARQLKQTEQAKLDALAKGIPLDHAWVGEALQHGCEII